MVERGVLEAEWMGVGNGSSPGRRIGEEGCGGSFRPIIVNAVTFPIITRTSVGKEKKNSNPCNCPKKNLR